MLTKVEKGVVQNILNEYPEGLEFDQLMEHLGEIEFANDRDGKFIAREYFLDWHTDALIELMMNLVRDVEE